MAPNRLVGVDSTDSAALYWFAELEDREYTGWRKAAWAVKSVIGGFVGHGPDVADLVIARSDTGEVVSSRPAGDVTEAGQMLVTARRELFQMTKEQFAAEWSLDARPTGLTTLGRRSRPADSWTRGVYSGTGIRRQKERREASRT